MNYRKLFKKIDLTLNNYGFDRKKFLKKLSKRNSGWFERDFSKFLIQRGEDTLFKMYPANPILTNINEEGGTMKGHYFHQDLYVARKIFERNPMRHVDIGSRTDGFIAHLATFREVWVLDIRPIESKVKNIYFQQADLMQIQENLVQSTDSISSLHAIEHFGLGRYGDPIDYFGYLKAIENIEKILKPNGIFYFSTPIGEQRVEFNAHRVFSLDYLIKIFSEKFKIIEFSYVDDQGDFHENMDLSPENSKNNFGCFWGCGIFILQKK